MRYRAASRRFMPAGLTAPATRKEEDDMHRHLICDTCGTSPAVHHCGDRSVCEDPQCLEQALAECATSFVDPEDVDWTKSLFDREEEWEGELEPDTGRRHGS